MLIIKQSTYLVGNRVEPVWNVVRQMPGKPDLILAQCFSEKTAKRLLTLMSKKQEKN